MHIFSLIIDALAAACGSLVLYRLVLHPLRQHPGPWFAKITDLYGGTLAARRRFSLEAARLHSQYGPVIRVGPNRLLFNSATAFQDIYGSDKHITKAWTYELLTRNKVYSTFNTTDRAIHRTKRKLISQAFSKEAMEAFEPVIIRQVDVFLEILRRRAEKGKPVNMTERLRYLAIDIMGLLALGYDLETQTTDENRILPELFAANFYVGNIWIHFPFFRSIHNNRIFGAMFPGMREQLSRLLEKMIRFRLSLNTHARPDLLSFVAKGPKNPKSKIRTDAIWKESLILLTTGGDTVASGLAATFFYLSRNPACHRKLAKEIRTKFPNSGSIKGGIVLDSCRYLRACIDEALRMSPPVPTNLWRQQVAADKTPLTIDGHYVPKGTLFGVNLYAFSHNEEIFTDPHTYTPDRWLGEDEATKRMKDSFASFSIGPRNCAGKEIAYLEMSIAIAKTLWNFDFGRAQGDLASVGEAHDRGRPHEFEAYDAFNSAHDGPYLVFRSRS
ncbi:cytochrome P450 [Sarocladium strictum]